MDAYDRCINLGKKILPILLPSMVEAWNFSDHPRKGAEYEVMDEIYLAQDRIQ